MIDLNRILLNNIMQHKLCKIILLVQAEDVHVYDLCSKPKTNQQEKLKLSERTTKRLKSFKVKFDSDKLNLFVFNKPSDEYTENADEIAIRVYMDFV